MPVLSDKEMFGYRSILTEAPRPGAIRAHPRAPWLAVGVVCFGAFMGQLDASIVTLTFRPMEQDFGDPLAAVQWVSLAYLLALVALVTPAGRIADAAGRKLIYTYGFVIFTAGSAACGFAPTLGILVICRVLQAAGAAMLQANSVAIVSTSVPPGRMRLALSIQAAAQAVGLGLGPTLGGLLTQTAGWRAVYWINVPVGCLAVVAGRYLLPRSRQLTRTDSFDWAGAALLGLTTSALLVALSVAGGLPAPGWFAALMAVVACGAAAVFALRQRRARFPLIPPPLLRSGRVVLGLAGAFLGYLALFGPLVLVPQLLQARGDEVRTGLILSVLPAGFGVAALTAEAVFPAALPNRTRGAIGAAVSAAALAGLIFTAGPTAAIVALLGVAGLGLGVFVPANNALIMRSAGADSASVLGGLVNMARGIGTTFGIALVTLALHLEGGALAFAMLAAAAASGAVISMTIKPLARQRGAGAPATAGQPEGAGPTEGAGMDHSSAFS
jgi:MFS family permease